MGCDGVFREGSQFRRTLEDRCWAYKITGDGELEHGQAQALERITLAKFDTPLRYPLIPYPLVSERELNRISHGRRWFEEQPSHVVP